jgi:Sodium/hydrogen exchanger family
VPAHPHHPAGMRRLRPSTPDHPLGPYAHGPVHRLVLPTVVLEIVLGIVIGREVLGWAEVDSYLTFLANFGLVFLFFFAGLEVVAKRVPRRSLVLGTVAGRSRSRSGSRSARCWRRPA